MRNKFTRKIVHQKLVNYFFNPENKNGWAKGQWFVRALGFNPGNIDHISLLEKQIAYNNNVAAFTHHTVWGPRFIQKLTVTGPTGKSIKDVIIIWQRDKNTRTIRLITMYPLNNAVRI